MPVMTGIEALPHILEAAPGTRVVVYASRREVRDEALRLGAARYLEKGRDPHAIAETVRDLPAS